MRIPTWRLVLTGGAVVFLVGAGIGMVAAGTGTPSLAPNAVGAAPTADPGATGSSERPAKERLERRAALGAKLLRIGRHLVHLEATVTDRDGKLVVLWLDHGTVQAASSGSLTLSETGGGTETIETDAQTIVRVGREDGTLSDVTAGDEVFVQSRVDGGRTLAKRILIIPTKPG
jgi:hypothetical protein